MILATNALLAKQISEKDVTITRSTKEMSDPVNIITTTVGKNHAANNNNNNNSNNNAEKYHLTGRGQKIQTIPHLVQMNTAGHTVIM